MLILCNIGNLKWHYVQLTLKMAVTATYFNLIIMTTKDEYMAMLRLMNKI